MKLCLTLVTLLLIQLPVETAVAQLDKTTIRFVDDVLLGTEYGETDRICARWETAPTLSTFSDSSHHPVLIKSVVNQINACLPESRQIQTLEPNDDRATMKVYFFPRSRFAEICEKHDARYIGENHGYFAIKWNGKKEITSAAVMIGHDKLSGNRLQHFLLEEMTQSMGLGGDSNRFDDSVFYEDASKNKFGTATRLSKLDRKLIRFLYEHAEPGMVGIEIGILMGQQWNND